MKKQSLLSLLVVGLLGATSATSVSIARAGTSSTTWGSFQVPGAGTVPVELLQSQGQTFVGLWYLERLFVQSGWTAKWDGHKLTLAVLPSTTSVKVSLNQQPLPAGSAISYQGTTYVDLNHIAQSLRGSVSFDGTGKALSLRLAVTSLTDWKHGIATAPIRTAAMGSEGGRPTPRTTTKTAQAVSHAPVGKGIPLAMGNKTLGLLPMLRSGETMYVGLTEVTRLLGGVGIRLFNHGGTITVSGLPILRTGITLQSPSMGLPTTKPKPVTAIEMQSEWFVPVDSLKSIGFQLADSHSTSLLSFSLVEPASAGSGSTTGTTTGTSTVAKNIQVAGHLVDNGGQPVAGEVTFEDPSGNLLSLVSDASGAFQGTISVAIPETMPSGASDLTLVGAETAQTGWVTQYASLTSQNGVISNITVNAEAPQLFSTVQGHVTYAGGALATMPVGEVSVRNVITQAHYYAPVDSQGNFSGQVPVGPYEVFALITKKAAIYSLQPFTVTPSPTPITVNVPGVPASGKLPTQHAVVVAGDSGVLPENLLSVANVFKHVYPLDQNTLHLSEQSPITITLYSSMQNYAQHFESEGYSKTDAEHIAENSGAVTEGPTSMAVPMESFGQIDGLNVLAHELDHAMVATKSLQLPSWANEGLAWHQGILGQLDGSPSQLLLEGAEWTEWFDIVQNQMDNSLLLLGTAGPLSGSYNVEDQDYYAVQDLINRYGMNAVLDYVNKYDQDPSAFQDVFGTSFLSFTQQVSSDLTTQAAVPAKGFSVTLKVLEGGPQDMYIQNNKGVRVLISGLQPGQEYTISCSKTGQLTLPSTLTSSKATALSQVVAGDWYFGVGVGLNGSLEQTPATSSASDASTGIALGAGYRQEFEVANQFGVPFLVRSVMYDASNQIMHAYPSIELPAGLELVSLTPTS